MLALPLAACADDPLIASEKAAGIDARIDWSHGRLIAVQDGGRYKTLDSFARESMSEMTGDEHLPGLSPMASLFEWLFNRPAYADEPLIVIKAKGVRVHLSAHMPAGVRDRIQETGRMTPRELDDPTVQNRIRELEPMAPMVTAMRRVRNAEVVARALERLMNIVPTPVGSKDAPWHTIDDLRANLPAELQAAGTFGGAMAVDPGATGPIPGLSEQQAVTVLARWAGLWKGWREADAEKVQANLDGLAAALPTLAAEGVYPAEPQRAAEASYYAWGKFTWGYWFYLLGLIVAIPALVTHWRAFWAVSMLFLVVAMAVHAVGIGLRWYILGRIPVANMFEAIVGSAWIGIAVALALECRYKTRIALIAANATGFLALVLAGYVVPGGGTLTAIMGILDDVMLRIHTVLIIASYALIFLASVIAVIYLFGYYFHKSALRSAEFSAVCGAFGFVLFLLCGWVFEPVLGMSGEWVKSEAHAKAFSLVAVAAAVGLAAVARSDVASRMIAVLVGAFLISLTLAIGSHGFANGMAWIMIAVGAAWSIGNLAGYYANEPVPVAAAARQRSVSLALAGGGSMAHGLSMSGGATGGGPVGGGWNGDKPLLAGGLPEDVANRELPAWLRHTDWCHLIILNMVFVMLFVGTILGAVWADYSWGRPWGWDPKEVFALNTWIIYVILIHVRFVTVNRGLWTAWLSVAGCLMMAFNWCFVNFYIVGLHSYA
jgi:ABC-type transport system involved in cytochrome c biogenesis permease subunit